MRVTRRAAPDSAARLKALTRRAYTATSGHLDLEEDPGADRAAAEEFDRIVHGPGAPDGDRATAHRAPPARRWAVSGRAAVVVLVVAAVLAGAVVARAIAQGPSEPVPQLEQSATPDGERAPAGSPAGATGGAPPDGGPTAAPAEEQPAVLVHVAGAVQDPGVVELPAGSRVGQAIGAAGGAQPEAELAAVNLARPVQDGEQVYVPRAGEAAPGSAGGSAPSGDGVPGAAPGAVVDLNSADLAALDTLPGVGPAIAQRILDWRDAHGPFHAVEELLEVSGIGPATLERLRDLVRV